MKKFLKIILLAILLAIMVSLILSIIDYTPVAERDPGTYYFSIGENFVYGVLYLTPIFLMISILAYCVYLLLKKFKPFNNFAMAGLSLLFAISLIALGGYIQKKNHETDDLYLIPEGYEGDVYVFYNVKGAPKVKMEDGYEVHPINDKGYFATSTPDMDYGRVTDQYYYVDKNGKRTPISEKCVSEFGTSGYSTSENEEIDLHFTGFRLTKEQCSDAYRTENHSSQDTEEEILHEVLKQYYGLD